MTDTTGHEAEVYITLDEAREQGLRMRYIRESLGPREVGTVYRSGYWGDVSTVTQVMIRVGKIRVRRGQTGSRLVTAAVGFLITEYNGGDARDRTHCTPWNGRAMGGDKILHGPGDVRPRRERQC